MLTDKILETKKVKQVGLSLQRKACINCFPPRRLGAKMVNNLVIVELSMSETTDT